MRDDFTEKTKISIAKRVAFFCSNPQCRRITTGPKTEDEGSICIGVAAHISAASPGGPRYDPSLTPEARRHQRNGIWLCQICAKLIDSDEKRFTTPIIKAWRQSAEEMAFQEIASDPGLLKRSGNITFALDEADLELIRGLGLPTEDDIESVTTRLCNAAKIDIQAFKNNPGWPKHPISLNLRSLDRDGVPNLNTAGIALAIELKSHVRIIAPPGTGKTTTLVHLSEHILTSNLNIAIFIPLAEWSSHNQSFFQSILRRNSYQGFREQHFMLLASHGRLVLLLDGWNELDSDSKTRAIHQIKALRRDYPLLGIVISTRRQARDVPLDGSKFEVEGLSEEQQLEMARAIQGKDGEALLDEAWRTPGVRELISIPLYLNALLSNGISGSMPTTKDEVLGLFVKKHEEVPERAEVFSSQLLGCHRQMLVGLAVEATKVTNTLIRDFRARSIVSQVEDRLVETGQITDRPQPQDVLDILVNQHTLIRASADGGVSFQHQQFQEWYASFEVERLILSAADSNEEEGKKLKAEILNMPAWEEPIFFACERLSRKNPVGARAVADTVIQTLSIDPILAAEIIYRGSPEVWDLIKNEILDFVCRWHKPDKVDQAVSFIITTGRQEFSSIIWPLITNSDTQIYLRAFRAARRFRPSVLGLNINERISNLPEQTRKNVLSGIAYESGMDGIELATNLTKSDPSVIVQSSVIESLLFRRADRFATDIMKVALDGVWPVLARKNYDEFFSDPMIASRMKSGVQTYIESEINPIVKIHLLMSIWGSDIESGSKIASLIESATFEDKENNAGWIINNAFTRYPKEVNAALLSRIEAGLDFPFNGKELLKKIPVVDFGKIPDIVIDCASNNHLADIATAVVGPKTVVALMDNFLKLDEAIQVMKKPINKKVLDEYHRLKDRISTSRTESFLLAFQNFRHTKGPSHISILANLFARHKEDEHNGFLQADPTLIEQIVSTFHCWIKVLLTSPKVNRHQFAEIARAINFIPRIEFVEDLNRFLVEDHSRMERERQEYFARPDRGSPPPGLMNSYSIHYQQAFQSIGGDKVVQLMEYYLSKPKLGFVFEAACVLRNIWEKQQNFPEKKYSWSFFDFSDVKERRHQRQKPGPHDTSPPAEAIFRVIKEMIPLANNGEKQHRVLALAKIGLSMPYGEKRSLIEALLAFPLPILEKHDLFVSLILAGETISANFVLDGIKELLKNVKNQTLLPQKLPGMIVHWSILLPFSDRPSAIHDALALVDERFRKPRDLKSLLSELLNAPIPNVEQLLEELASHDPRFYQDPEWIQALLNCGSEASVNIFLDSICDTDITMDLRDISKWHLAKDLAGIIKCHPKMKAKLLERYKRPMSVLGKSVFEQTIVHLSDEDGVLALVQDYARNKRHFDGTIDSAIREVALGKQPLADSGGSYELFSVDIGGLRKEIFAMLDGDSNEVRLAQACLTAIDEIRDEYGRVDSEPRHPDITSGRPWPQEAEKT